MGWVNGPCSATVPWLPAAEGHSLSFGAEKVFFVTGEHPGAAFFPQSHIVDVTSVVVSVSL